MSPFAIQAGYRPAGDQPQAIDGLVDGSARRRPLPDAAGRHRLGQDLHHGQRHRRRCSGPTLVISHNKTLAAQLYAEFKEFFPDNAVEYFVSYYDYYQPEAYVPQTRHLHREGRLDQRGDRPAAPRRHQRPAQRRDVIIVASVSCIYGLGSPEEYRADASLLKKGDKVDTRRGLSASWSTCSTSATTSAFARGKFRVRGDVLEIFPAYEELAVRIEFFGDEIERIVKVDPLTGEVVERDASGRHLPGQALRHCPRNASSERSWRHRRGAWQQRLAGARGRRASCWRPQRLKQRTEYDLEMLQEMGYCPGIENYSRILSRAGARLAAVHAAGLLPRGLPGLHRRVAHHPARRCAACTHGDRTRKISLVEYGFRLPSALDNRPLRFEEFEKVAARSIFVSATPAD